MKFHLLMQTDHVRLGSEVGVDAIAKQAVLAERLGFASVGVTEHPFPTAEFLSTPFGHDSLDPFVALSFAAASTSTIGLLTYLCVLPYRNPFLTAKAALSVHVLSGERLALGTGAGYLEGEFTALGVDFAERNELFSEALVAMRRAWREEEVVMRGRHFDVPGNTMFPRPAPEPPILIGGNSKRALRHVVESADGWMPLWNPAAVAAERRSAPLDSVAQLGEMISDLTARRAELDRERPMEVVVMPFVPFGPGLPGYDAGQLLEHLGALEAVGTTGAIVKPIGRDLTTILERIEQLGAEILQPFGADHAPIRKSSVSSSRGGA